MGFFMVSIKYGMTDTEAYSWAQQYECVQTYLSKLNSYREDAAFNLWLFCDWTSKKPDELLAMKAAFDDFTVERLLDKLVISKTKFPDTIKYHVIMTVRGFFRANYRQLQSQAGRMEYPNKGQTSPSKPKRLALFKACYSPRDRALALVSGCTAIALGTMFQLRWSHFEEDWMKQDVPHISIPPELLKGHGKGKYRGTRQETFLTPEAKNVLIEYRDWFSKTFNYTWSNDGYVFLSTRGNIGEPLTYKVISKTMHNLSRRSGVKWTVHDGRRIVQTALESSGCPNNWIKKIKGRKCSGEEAPYSKPNIEQLREKYREALPELEFLSESNINVKKLTELETKLGEKDQVIEALVRNGTELKEKMQKIEGSREGIDALLKRVLELEKKLGKNES
jgi:uncharacterized coiled-coil protein SlyX